MERYDGKTRKDDIKKYILIALAVVLVIILYRGLTSLIYKVSHPTPDLVVVYGVETVTDYQEEDDMEALMEDFASDLDGNGKVVVDVLPFDFQANPAMISSGVAEVAEDQMDSFGGCVESGYGLIYITHEVNMLEYYFTGDYLAELPEDLRSDEDPYRLDISGCGLLETQKLQRVEGFYAGIRKDATQEEYDTAVAILRGIKNG